MFETGRLCFSAVQEKLLAVDWQACNDRRPKSAELPLNRGGIKKLDRAILAVQKSRTRTNRLGRVRGLRLFSFSQLRCTWSACAKGSNNPGRTPGGWGSEMIGSPNRCHTNSRNELEVLQEKSVSLHVEKKPGKEGTHPFNQA